MSHALLVPVRSLDYPAAPVAARESSAVSEEAQAVRDAVGVVIRSVERSQALFGRKAAVIARVWALVNECAEPGWDGDGAEPLDRLAAFRAADFIRALPPEVPLPEVAPEPDGSISLDWIRSRNGLFSLTVGAGSRLAYAWLDGSDRGHGVVRFDGEAIPTRILHGVDAIMRHANAALGSS